MWERFLKIYDKYLIHFVRYGSLNINYCALMIDFSKAFDSVDHVVLLSKVLNVHSLTYLVLWLSGFAHFWLVQVSSVKLMAICLLVASISCSIVQGDTTPFLPGSDVFVGERGCRCWRHTTTRLMACRRPV